jgi:hypothetical protein
MLMVVWYGTIPPEVSEVKLYLDLLLAVTKTISLGFD